MSKPTVFIGSSTEGLHIAQAVFSSLNADAEPTLWTHQLFLPGHYPLESLESQLERHAFAILVASPDDELVKRGTSYPAMRDNLLLEFGLFVGALGRRHAFFVCPSAPRVELPSDLLGVITATYDVARVSGDNPNLLAAVELPCQQVLKVIKEEWASMQRRKTDDLIALQHSEKSKAVKSLYTVATRLRDTIIALQRDAFGAFSDRGAFESVKAKAANEVKAIAEAFADEARLVRLDNHLEQLRAATADALLDLPFPQELSLGKGAAEQKAVNIGFGALDALMRGGDPMRHIEDAVKGEAGNKMESLRMRYSEWWDKHSPRLQEASSKMQDGLFKVLVDIAQAR